ncbi:UNVERIFIED_CONTAM: hypothetical protein Sradi_6551600 [Sesamum radiatum]|uniref:Uncharacterized protein n=1 Tax=Sesamum radiatum TaxID=300843 RepID=A0AAW2JXW5_SESRA
MAGAAKRVVFSKFLRPSPFQVQQRGHGISVPIVNHPRGEMKEFRKDEIFLNLFVNRNSMLRRRVHRRNRDAMAAMAEGAWEELELVCVGYDS